MMLNTKQGPLAKLELRQAVQAALSMEDMLAAAFGNPEFFTVDGAMYPKASRGTGRPASNLRRGRSREGEGADEEGRLRRESPCGS